MELGHKILPLGLSVHNDIAVCRVYLPSCKRVRARPLAFGNLEAEKWQHTCRRRSILALRSRNFPPEQNSPDTEVSPIYVTLKLGKGLRCVWIVSKAH
jgi:hypothetical protein